MYDFNPLTPLDLNPFPSDVVIILDGYERAEAMKNLHEKAKLTANKEISMRVNNGQIRLMLQSCD